MHELSIALSIVDGVLEELHHRGATQASAVYLRVGRLSGVDKDALLFSYEVASQDTVLGRSNLVIEDVDITIFCPACGAERPIRSFPVLTCAACGAISNRVLQGHELEITAMEVA